MRTVYVLRTKDYGRIRAIATRFQRAAMELARFTPSEQRNLEVVPQTEYEDED